MINSLYHDVKYEYMCRNFFINDKLACDIASIFFMIENAENMLLDASKKNYGQLHPNDEEEVSLS